MLLLVVVGKFENKKSFISRIENSKCLTENSNFALQITQQNNAHLNCAGKIGGTAPSDDFDGDGLCNEEDLDDDNDGVLDEVENSCSKNIATEGRATSRAVCYGGVPTRINDGNTNGNWGNASVAHTCNARHEWIDLDLGEGYPIHEIIVWNRTDCCSERLSFCYLMVSSTPFPNNTNLAAAQDNATFLIQFGDAAGVVTITTAIQQKGRYIRVQKSAMVANGNRDKNSIQIAEIQVFTSCDTDADGIANYLDLDSDNDGCSDAYEAGASDSEALNFQFSDIPEEDANGISPTIDPSDNGNLNYTLTYANAIDGIGTCCQVKVPELSRN